MITHKVKQGSPEWLALRANYDTASEAPAMMGAPGAHETREELLRMKVSGLPRGTAPRRWPGRSSSGWLARSSTRSPDLWRARDCCPPTTA